MPYSPSFCAHTSPAPAWTAHAVTAALSVSICPSSAAVTPVSTSPLPPFAMPGLPASMTYIRPAGCAMIVRWPLSTVMQPYRRANSHAPRSRPFSSEPPRRRNSPSCGVITISLFASRRMSGTRDTAQSASASRTIFPGNFRMSAAVSAAVPSLRPRPGPSASTPQRS